MTPAKTREHENILRRQYAERHKIALDKIRMMVYAEIKPIVEALIGKAKDGDHKAAELLFDRTFGKAKENLAITGDVKFSLSSLAEQWKERQEQKKLDAPDV